MSIQDLIANEAWIKLGIFMGLLILLLTAERFFARRKSGNVLKRLVANFGLIIGATLLTRLIFPLAGVGLSLWADANALGLFHLVQWPIGLEIFLCLVLFDLAIYWQHRLFHMFPWLWRMHRVHHSDLAFDSSLGIRFHPFEIALSQAYKLGWIVLLGAAPAAVLIYESMLMAFSLLTHSNIRLPPRLDAWLRLIIVTPDFHRVHHSVHREESDSNYANTLSVWDRIFSSYQAQPRDGHQAMNIGLPEFRSTAEQTLGALLIQPFRNVKQIQDNEHA